MSDKQIGDAQDRLLTAARRCGLPDEAVDALVALLDLYVQRVTRIVAHQQVHGPAPAPTTRTATPAPGHDDPEEGHP